MEGDQASCFTVLMAEDDPDDRFVMEKAFQELGGCGDLRFVEDGEELMEYLRRVGKYADPASSPRPVLILLDLNMPKKDGRQALEEIKAGPDLQKIPVVIWTTCEVVEDRIQSRKVGAEDYLVKPAVYSEVANSIKRLVMKYTIPSGNMSDAT
jgi:CheY-like chemotaxis protein